MNMKKLDFKKTSLEVMFDLISFFIEYVINEMLIPGQVENWNIIINLKGMSLWSIPITVSLPTAKV